MAKKKPHLRNNKQAEPVKRKKKEKGKTQVHPYTMVMVVGPTGKKRMEKRPL